MAMSREGLGYADSRAFTINRMVSGNGHRELALVSAVPR